MVRSHGGPWERDTLTTNHQPLTTPPSPHASRLQLQRLHELLHRGDDRADRRRWATRGWNCWPTCRTPGRPGCCPSGSRRSATACDEHGLAIANVNAFMMNAVADPRQPYWHPSWIEPDPHYRAIRREHTKRALALAAELGAPSIQTEPGGPLAAGPVVAGGRRRVLRRVDALRRSGRAARGAAA